MAASYPVVVSAVMASDDVCRIDVSASMTN